MNERFALEPRGGVTSWYISAYAPAAAAAEMEAPVTRPTCIDHELVSPPVPEDEFDAGLVRFLQKLERESTEICT